MLFILHCLTQTKSDYFVQDRPVDDDLEAPPSLQRNESLGSIKNLKAELQIRENHPLYDLLQLCSRDSIIHNTANVEILASIIESICKNPKIFKVIAEEDEEEKKLEDDKKKETKKKRRRKLLILLTLNKRKRQIEINMRKKRFISVNTNLMNSLLCHSVSYSTARI